MSVDGSDPALVVDPEVQAKEAEEEAADRDERG
ncbi:Putative nosiheptide resistance regulatory protein OS=Streptomyces glaucescens OX=1907 GN=SGLAU_17105 PE=4 SV=1 [Streptomyces glaucescens]